MPVQPFEECNIQDAYRSIQTFFNHYILRDAVYWLESILRAATTPAIWKKEDPAQLLLYMELLQELIAAALEIHYSYSIRDDALLTRDNRTGILLQEHFVSNNSASIHGIVFRAALAYSNTTIRIKQLKSLLPAWQYRNGKYL